MVKRVVRWGIRLLVLVLASVFVLGGPIPRLLARVLPSLSPLVAVVGTIAARDWYMGFFWGIPPAAILAMSVWKGRWFCRWLCPAGTLYALPGRFTLKRQVLKRKINGVVFWTILSSSVLGVSMLAFVEPLASVNRLAGLSAQTYTVASLVPGLMVPLFLLLGLIQPMVWCTQICPLGYLFDVMHAVRRRRRPVLDRVRRELLVGACFGVPVGLAARHGLATSLSDDAHAAVPVLPPGAGEPDRFASLCTRCYACVHSCPTRVLTVLFKRGRTLSQFFHPELETIRSHCDSACNRCSQVCPAGAIAPLTVAEKQCRQIGIAEVHRWACFSWARAEECMTCHAVCPYGAISSEPNVDGLDRPVVDVKRCRGCGACESECPSEEQGKAIRAHGVETQALLEPVEVGAVPTAVGPSDESADEDEDGGVFLIE